MFARRPTILTLVILSSGLGLAVVVAETSQEARSRGIGLFIPCAFEQGITCLPPRR